MNEADLLLVPPFARLVDYVGLWCVEDATASRLFRLARGLDLQAHVAANQDLPRAAVEKLPASDGRSVAMIRMSGLLMKGTSSLGGTSSIQLRRDIRQAAGDPDVSGILLVVDSPGGTVAGTDELAQEVRSARRHKPVMAQVEDLAASAAYWVASQADRVYANSPTALVGSIGTYQVLHDESAAAEMQGVRTLVFATGPLKGMGVPGSKVTEEQAAHVRSLVDAMQASFDRAVQKGRGLTDRQLADVRHGGVLPATAALDAKLIDGIQPITKTLAELAQVIRSGGPRADVDMEIDAAAFAHNSDTSPDEPDWGAVDKAALPRMAFAEQGDAGKKSTWGYPHHWVRDPGGKGEDGVWTTGTLLLHRGGLDAAWSAAQGGRSGKKAGQDVIDHLQAHRRALGLDKPGSVLPTIQQHGLPTMRKRQ